MSLGFHDDLTKLMLVITYRRGKFDATEKKAIKQHLDLFKTVSSVQSIMNR